MTMTQLFMLCKLLEMEDKVVASFFLSYLREVPGELFEGVGDDDLVVGERGAEDVELKLVEAVGEPCSSLEAPTQCASRRLPETCLIQTAHHVGC